MKNCEETSTNPPLEKYQESTNNIIHIYQYHVDNIISLIWNHGGVMVLNKNQPRTLGKWNPTIISSSGTCSKPILNWVVVAHIS